MDRAFESPQLTIASSGTTTGAITVADREAGSIQFPAAMTGTELAVEGQCGESGAWVPVHDSSGAITIAFAASTIQSIPAEAFRCTQIRFVSNGTEAAARTFHVHTRA